MWYGEALGEVGMKSGDVDDVVLLGVLLQRYQSLHLVCIEVNFVISTAWFFAANVNAHLQWFLILIQRQRLHDYLNLYLSGCLRVNIHLLAHFWVLTGSGWVADSLVWESATFGQIFQRDSDWALCVPNKSLHKVNPSCVHFVVLRVHEGLFVKLEFVVAVLH